MNNKATRGAEKNQQTKPWFKPIVITFKGRQQQVYDRILTDAREAVHVIDDPKLLWELQNELREVIAIASMLEYNLKHRSGM